MIPFSSVPSLPHTTQQNKIEESMYILNNKFLRSVSEVNVIHLYRVGG